MNLTMLRKKKLVTVFVVLSLVFLLNGVALGQAYPVKWMKSFWNNSDSIHATTALHNGRIIGSTSSWHYLNTNTNICKIVITKTGGTLIREIEFGNDNAAKRIYKILPHNSQESGFYTVGFATKGGSIFNADIVGQDGWLSRFDSAGNILQTRFWGMPGGNEIFHSVATTHTSHLLVAGEQYFTSQNNKRAVLLKYEKSTLDTVWTKEYSSYGIASFSDVKELSTGNFVAVGKMNLYGGQQSVVVLLDVNGEVIWCKSMVRNALLNSTDSLITYQNRSNVTSVMELDGDIFLVGNADWGGDESISFEYAQSLNIFAARITLSGNLVWQKEFGGSLRDYVKSAELSPGGKVLVSACTNSVGGDIPYRISPANDRYDMWFFEFDANGALSSNVVLGGSNIDLGMSAQKLPGGDMIIAGVAYSSNGHFPGAATRHYAFWIGRIEGTGGGIITGRGFYDANNDGIKQSSESNQTGYRVYIKQNEDTVAITDGNASGYFGVPLAIGTYQCSIVSTNPYYLISPQSVTLTLNGITQPDTIFIGLKEITEKKDLSVSMLSSIAARPGFGYGLLVIAKNTGTEVIGDSIRVILNPKTIVGNDIYPAFFSRRGDTLVWTMASFTPKSEKIIYINSYLATPPNLNNGDTLLYKAEIFPISNDLTPHNNTFTLQQLVTGSYDPNDKTESHAGVLTQEEIDGGEYLNYLIRFQNTGTDTAFTVVIRDTLESRLDVSSLEMITASHDYTLSIQNSNQLSWTFNNILLADSNINEPASHGYVQFRIKPYPTLAPGDTIRNTAAIYFDYNLPVLTNMEKTTLFIPGTLPVKLLKFTALRKNDRNELNWETAEETNSSHFIVERSFNGSQFSEIGRVIAKGMPASYTFSEVSPEAKIVYYRLKIIDIDGSFSHSPVMLVRLDANFSAILYPNPVGATASLEINSNGAKTIQWSLRDMQGRLRQLRSLRVPKGKSTLQVSLDHLEPGMYVVSLSGPELEQNILIIKK